MIHLKKLVLLAVLSLLPVAAQAAPNVIISGSVWFAGSSAPAYGAQVWVCITPTPCYGNPARSTTVAGDGSFTLLPSLPEFNGKFYLYAYRPTPASVAPGAPTGTWGSTTIPLNAFYACSTYINSQNQCASDINYADPQTMERLGGNFYPSPLPPGAVNPFDGQGDYWIHDTGLTWSSGRDSFRSAGQYMMTYDVYRAAEGSPLVRVATAIPCSSSYQVNCSWTQPTSTALDQLTTYHWYVVAQMSTPQGVLTTTSPLFTYTTGLSRRRPSSTP